MNTGLEVPDNKIAPVGKANGARSLVRVANIGRPEPCRHEADSAQPACAMDAEHIRENGTKFGAIRPLPEATPA